MSVCSPLLFCYQNVATFFHPAPFREHFVGMFLVFVGEVGIPLRRHRDNNIMR